MSRVARLAGAHRSSVGRWRAKTVKPSLEHCEKLAKHFPAYFDLDVLRSLYAADALGTDVADLTVGLSSAGSTEESYARAVAALEQNPPKREDRVLLHTIFHLDQEAAGSDQAVRSEVGESLERMQGLMVQRAAEGWKVRIVLSVGKLARFENLRDGMLRVVNGPNVEVRAYPISLPLMIYPMIVGRRDVLLAFDDRRISRPASALALRSPSIVTWATEYFDTLFLDAPYVLRTVRGIDSDAVTLFESKLS